MLKSIFRWVILITFLLIRLIVQGGLRLLKETSRPEVLWRGWPRLLRVGKPHPLWRLAQRNGVESQCQKYLCNAQDTNEGKQKVVNDYVVLLCGLIDKAGSRLLFPPEPLILIFWRHFGKTYRNKPCKKYPTPYGGRSLYFLSTSKFQDDIYRSVFFPGWFGPSLVKPRLCVTSRTRRRSATRRGWAYRLIGCSTLVPLQVVSDHVHVLPSGLQDHGATDQRREERG